MIQINNHIQWEKRFSAANCKDLPEIWQGSYLLMLMILLSQKIKRSLSKMLYILLSKYQVTQMWFLWVISDL